jgi:transcriptional regulator with XRE-family HTH domain
MRFRERIKQLREERQIPQRQFVAALEIDTATYCKRGKVERRAKREQVIALAEIFNVNPDEVLNLWIADRIFEVVKDEKELAVKALKIVQKEINN